MSENEIVWQGRCAICGWTSAYGPIDHVEGQADVHVHTQHPRPAELQRWVEEQEAQDAGQEEEA